MKRTRAERISNDNTVNKKIKKIEPYGFLFLKYCIKDRNGKEYITGSGKKMASKAYYKRVSNKSIRNYTKRQLLKDMETTEVLKSGEYKKLFDYWWTLY